ncbi:YbaB/EbfC family nucleoid-associated protein [Amycolatopsis sp. 195334CR]|uniref:YbaB/EbfC family nucleoid-associated protein n=1 Tax=Amycolatopsis sp. 195334CR TaxID=2814588 RepID=UPI001A8C2D3C|nr:YbaB/EbfC family nucleoid-associated protein [Amycolatopsis sp. 195334CR]MBN6036179.1 YbaB/EbfC family nucleoid-associated protein [Amycolatopsis sp. 195334CR]
MTSPDQLFADFEAKLAETQRKAEQMRAEIETVSVSERSKDGQIKVTVNHAGNLTGLEIGPIARAKADLDQQIMRTMQAAQSKLAEAMRGGVPSIAGTETMAELIEQLNAAYPEPEPTDYVEGGYAPTDEGSRFVAEHESPAPAPAATPPPPAAPAPERRPRPARPTEDAHDDDYFSGNDFLTDEGDRR